MLSQEAIPFWTAVAAVAAAGSALVAAAYTYLTYRLVQIQGEPKVIVYVKHDLDRASILVITIENIGRDIAHEVSFRSSRPIPAQAFGLSSEDAGEAEVMADGPLIEGIPALGPGDSREITWGQFGGLSKAVGRKPIIIDYSYLAGRRKLSGSAKLEVQSFLGTDASEKPVAVIARSVKDIASTAKQITSILTAQAISPPPRQRRPDNEPEPHG